MTKQLFTDAEMKKIAVISRRNFERDMRGMLASPLIRRIIAGLNPDMAKLRAILEDVLMEAKRMEVLEK